MEGKSKYDYLKRVAEVATVLALIISVYALNSQSKNKVDSSSESKAASAPVDSNIQQIKIEAVNHAVLDIKQQNDFLNHCGQYANLLYRSLSNYQPENMETYLEFPLWTEAGIYSNVTDFNTVVFQRVDESFRKNPKFDLQTSLINIYTFLNYSESHKINPALKSFIQEHIPNYGENIVFAEVLIKVDESDKRALVFNKATGKIVGIMDI